ncbi:TIGR01841 family phasin [Noviherbaspirillum sedimenti]|uniref:Phasin family protein n=1 Tax=Noviherbaspirillum sedimenti TaxID=2320865 RepID=A0A3A3G8A3_9BURK|nr:TIGR01841 family phasin [Noviherbaspirillum sedimenti]RJG02792.1 phasin family protein [Noviherbaspirillum sedimenti]
MFSIQDQFSAATKANVEAQLALISALTTKAFEGVEKLIDLNLTVAKTSLEESNAAAKQLMAAKDPQEFFSLAAAQAQPTAEKAASYARHVANIASSTQAEITKTAEAQIAETSRKVASLVDDVAKNAPAGSENMIAAVKSMIGNANAGYEQFAKTTKQAVEAIETNLSTATAQFAHAADKATGRAKK